MENKKIESVMDEYDAKKRNFSRTKIKGRADCWADHIAPLW